MGMTEFSVTGAGNNGPPFEASLHAWLIT